MENRAISHSTINNGSISNGTSGPQLLSPFQMGSLNLSHRVVLAPMTRCRALDNIPQPSHVEFYSQRTTREGLLITEANTVSQQAIGYYAQRKLIIKSFELLLCRFPHSHGIFNDEQVKAWKNVVDAVHEKGGIIFCQIWHVGRESHTVYQPTQEAVADEIGAERTAIRLSPIIDHNGATDYDPLALTRYLIRLLNRYPLAYLHLTEPRFTSEGLKQAYAKEAEMMAVEMWSMVRGGIQRSADGERGNTEER